MATIEGDRLDLLGGLVEVFVESTSASIHQLSIPICLIGSGAEPASVPFHLDPFDLQ
jgi:hypothetical protein